MASNREQRFKPASSLRYVSVARVETASRRRQAKVQVPIVRPRPRQRLTNIVELEVHRGDPAGRFNRTWLSIRDGCVVLGVQAAGRIQLAGLLKSVLSVGTQALEQPIPAGTASRVRRNHE